MQQQIIHHISWFQPQFHLVLPLRSCYPLQCQECFLHLHSPHPDHCNCSFLIWTKNVFIKIVRGSLYYWLHFYTPFILICNLFTTHTSPTSSLITLACFPFLPTKHTFVTKLMAVTMTCNLYFYCIIKVHNQSHKNYSAHTRFREISFSYATEIKKTQQNYPAPLPPQIYISYIYFKTQKTKTKQNYHTKPPAIT